jgi:hypothetical protein
MPKKVNKYLQPKFNAVFIQIPHNPEKRSTYQFFNENYYVKETNAIDKKW